jgi:hypothetical protein
VFFLFHFVFFYWFLVLPLYTFVSFVSSTRMFFVSGISFACTRVSFEGVVIFLSYFSFFIFSITRALSPSW